MQTENFFFTEIEKEYTQFIETENKQKINLFNEKKHKKIDETFSFEEPFYFTIETIAEFYKDKTHRETEEAKSEKMVQETKIQQTFILKKQKKKTLLSGPICINCGTEKTTLWRRIGDKVNCNACALYYNLHKKERPKHLYTKKIRKRNRKKNF